MTVDTGSKILQHCTCSLRTGFAGQNFSHKIHFITPMTTSSVLYLLSVASPVYLSLWTDESLFQVKVGPIQHCSKWMVSTN